MFPVNPLTGLLGFLGARDHLVPESGLRRLIERHVEYAELEELPIPLHVVAVDVVTGQELRLSNGPVLDAVLASAAIPGVLSPVSWEDRALMERRRGQQHADLPRGRARSGAHLRTSHGHACSLDQPPRGALAMALHAISLLTHRRLIDDIERHRADAHLIVMPPPCPLNIQPVDFAHAAELIAVALLDAREFLDSGGETRAPIRMRMHRHALAPERAPHAQPASAAKPPTIAP